MCPHGLLPFSQFPKPCPFNIHKPFAAGHIAGFALRSQPPTSAAFSRPEIPPSEMKERLNLSAPFQDTGQPQGIAGAHLPSVGPSEVLILAEGLCPWLPEGTGSFPHLHVF